MSNFIHFVINSPICKPNANMLTILCDNINGLGRLLTCKNVYPEKELISTRKYPIIYINYMQSVPCSHCRITEVVRQPEVILSHWIGTDKPGFILVKLAFYSINLNFQINFNFWTNFNSKLKVVETKNTFSKSYKSVNYYQNELRIISLQPKGCSSFCLGWMDEKWFYGLLTAIKKNYVCLPQGFLWLDRLSGGVASDTWHGPGM